MDCLKAILTNNYICHLSYFPKLASTLVKLQTQGHQIDAQVNNLQKNLHMANHVPKVPTTGNLSSVHSQSFHNSNAIDINMSINLKLTNLSSLVSIVSDICKVWQKYMTPCCSCCRVTHYKYMAQLHSNVTCNPYYQLNYYTRICLTRLLKSHGFKAAP
jgi:hypothetical protein